MRNGLFFTFLLALLIGLPACDDDGMEPNPNPNPNPMDTIDMDTMIVDTIPDTLLFEKVKLFDENGSPIGCYPDCEGDTDWENVDLSDVELGYLDFESMLEWSDPDAMDIENIRVFPVPMADKGDLSIAITANGAAALKLALINNKEEILWTQSLLLADDFNNFSLNAELFSELKRKEIYRLFYAVENSNQEYIFQGFGDFTVCTQDVNPDFTTCFYE